VIYDISSINIVMNDFLVRLVIVFGLIFIVCKSLNTSEGFRHKHTRNHGLFYVTRDDYPLQSLSYPDGYRSYPDEA
jgi:hypothetical protein